MLSWTFILYFTIILSTTLLAFRSQRCLGKGVVKFEKSYFIASFLIHWFFIAFTHVGSDYPQYMDIIQYYCKDRMDLGDEVGFNGLCYILYYYLGNTHVVIFLFKTLAIVIFYRILFLIRYKADLGLSIFAYNIGNYFFGYYVLAHAIAISLTTYAVLCVIQERKWYWPLILGCVAATIHTSAILIVVVLLAIEISNRFKIKSGLLFLLTMFASIIVLTKLSVLFDYFISNFIYLDKAYGNYSESGNEGTGLFNYFSSGIIFISIIYPIIRSDLSQTFKNTSVILFIFGFISSIMGYFLGSARLNYYGIALSGVIIPWYFFHVRNGYLKTKPLIPNKMQLLIWILYLTFMGYGELKVRTDPNSPGEMHNYELSIPF